jgi:hypothetical protein
MIRYISLLFFMVLASSCQFFETEKVSADAIYSEDIKTIAWDEIDQYPTFVACESHTDKEPQLACFVAQLSKHINATFAQKKTVSRIDLNDTILIDFGVSNKGKITGLAIQMDSITQRQLPSIKSWLMESMELLPASEPAYKRGIPVATKFSLPIVIKTNSTTN